MFAPASRFPKTCVCHSLWAAQHVNSYVLLLACLDYGSWRPCAALALDVAAAKQRLCKAACLWKAVSGPASAFVASALRLGWEVHDFSHVTDDAGNKFDFTRDSPALVKQMVAESVRRWQMRRVDATFTSADLGGAFRLPPLAKLLRSSAKDWGPAERAQLHSAIVGGQWTQLRLFRHGRAESSLCLQAHGAMAHRLWWCEHPEMAAARRRHVPPSSGTRPL